jgi:hypothetical protein
MLFDRFIFILYILLNYSWLLLGIIYESAARIIPVSSIIFSLLSVIIVTLFQLQTIVQRHKLDYDGKWSTISWSVVHIIICIFFLVDILELVNILVVFGILGLFLTFVSFAVLILSCKVIASGSDAWIPHVHLTCICFWVLVNYLYVSLPTNLPFMTVLPVVLILVLRLYENSRSLKQICIETTLFLIVIALHICLDLKQISAEHFYQMIAIIIALMIFMARESKSIIILLGLPFILSGFVFYCIGCFILNKEQPSVESLTEKYNRFVEIDDLVLSLDGSEIEENWDEKL